MLEKRVPPSFPAPGVAASGDVTSPAERLLGQAPIFRGADPADLEPLAALASFQLFARGEHLFRAGDPVDTMYVVSAGSVRVYRLARGAPAN